MIYQYPKLQTDLIIGPIPEHLPAWSSCYTSQKNAWPPNHAEYIELFWMIASNFHILWPVQPPISLSSPGHVLSTIILTPQIICWFYLTFLRIYCMVNLIFESHTHTHVKINLLQRNQDLPCYAMMNPSMVGKPTVQVSFFNGSLARCCSESLQWKPLDFL